MKSETYWKGNSVWVLVQLPQRTSVILFKAAAVEQCAAGDQVCPVKSTGLIPRRGSAAQMQLQHEGLHLIPKTMKNWKTLANYKKQSK